MTEFFFKVKFFPNMWGDQENLIISQEYWFWDRAKHRSVNSAVILMYNYWS